jgi:hypothetical protein
MNNSNATAIFSPQWQDFNISQDLARQSLLPWNWTVEPRLPLQRLSGCPSRLFKLGSFALVNFVTLIATLTLGRRDIVHWLTREKFGKLGSPWWPLSALLTTGLNIAATFINARLVTSTPGYGATRLNDLALLWFCRPRLSWLAILLLNWSWDEGIYVGLGASAVLSEIIMQGLAAYYMGLTANLGGKYGYYRPGHIENVIIPWGKPASMIYAGALLWMASIGFVVLAILWTFIGLGTLTKRLFRHLSGQAHVQAHTTEKTMKELARGMLRENQAMASTLKPRFAQTLWVRLVRGLSPMRKIVQMVGHAFPAGNQPGQINGQNQIQMPEHPQFLNNGNPEQEVPVIGYLHGTETTTDLPNWIQNMGLSSEVCKKMALVFLFMIPAFIGQWLFWVGFVDLYEDLFQSARLLWNLLNLFTISKVLST